jgi:hypothetical protein
MTIFLLEDSLRVEVYFEHSDMDFEDNICISFYEDCPYPEKIFRAGETNIYLTHEQACQLGKALLEAAGNSDEACSEAKWSNT